MMCESSRSLIFLAVILMGSSHTFSYKLRKSAKKKKEQARDKYTIIIRRQIGKRGQYLGSVINIKSARLCNVLLDINKGVEDIELSRSEPVVRCLPPSAEHS